MALTQQQKNFVSNMVAAFVTEFEFSGYYLQLCDAMYSQANHSLALCDIIYNMHLANVMNEDRLDLLVNMRMIMIGQALDVLNLENGRIILTNLGAEFLAPIANLFRINGQGVALYARDLLFSYSMCTAGGPIPLLPPRPINMFRANIGDAQLVRCIGTGICNGVIRTLNRFIATIANPYRAAINYIRFMYFLFTDPVAMVQDIVGAAMRSCAEDPAAFICETFLNALLIHCAPVCAPPGASVAIKFADVTMTAMVNMGHSVQHSSFLIGLTTSAAHSGHHAGAVLQAGPTTGQGPVPVPMMCSSDPTSISAVLQQAGVANNSVDSGLAQNLTQVSQSHHMVQQTLLPSTTSEAATATATAAAGGLGAALLAHNEKSYRHKFNFEIEILPAPCDSQVSLQELELLQATVKKARHSGLSSSMKEALAWMGKPMKKDIKPVSDVVKIKQRTDAFERYQRKRR